MQDRGEYKCKDASDNSRILMMHAEVKEPIQFTITPSFIMQRRVGQSATLSCSAFGDPKPSIRWRKIGGELPERMRIVYEADNLTIVHLNKEDQGLYECVASNSITSSVCSSLLIVEASLVRPPYNLTGWTTWDTLSLCWLPAYDLGHQPEYLLWYRQISITNTSWLTIQANQQEPPTFCNTISYLESNSFYEVKVVARNKLGEDFQSEVITIKTKSSKIEDYEDNHDLIASSGFESKDQYDEDELINFENFKFTNKKGIFRPPPPQNISVIKMKNGLYISWLPPSSLSSSLLTYSIQYQTHGSWLLLTDKPIKETYTTWSTHSLGVTYKFRVFSHLEVNVSSSPSPVVSIHIPSPFLTQKDITTKMIIAIFAVVLLLIIFFILLYTLIKSCCFRHRNRLIRYNNVKYFGPTQREHHCKQKKLNNFQKEFQTTSDIKQEFEKITTAESSTSNNKNNENNKQEQSIKTVYINNDFFFNETKSLVSSALPYNLCDNGLKYNNSFNNFSNNTVSQISSSVNSLSYQDRKIMMETPI